MNEIKQGYKQTDIGVIPEAWEVKKLGQLCIPSKSRINPITSTINYKCIELEHLSQNSGVILGYANSKDLLSQKSVFEKGDVLFGKLRPYLKKYWFAEFNGVCTSEIWVLKATNFISNLFLFHLVQSERVIESANLSTGTKMPRAEWKTVAETEIPFPPTQSEQSAIANALSDVDALIAALDKKITKKQQIKQGAMQQLLTGKKRLPGFSGDWVEKKLGDCFNKVVGGGTPSRSVAEYWNGNIPWATVKDFASFNPKFTQENITSLGLHNSASHLIPKETPITSTRMGLGKIMIYSVDVAINQDMKALFISEDYEKNYIIHWFVFSQEKIELMGTGSTVKGIRLEQLNDIEIHLPHTKSEQTAIAQILTDMDNEISQLEADRDKYMQIKAGMMQQLLTGKIRLVN